MHEQTEEALLALCKAVIELKQEVADLKEVVKASNENHTLYTPFVA
jgi:hypothetical protein